MLQVRSNVIRPLIIPVGGFLGAGKTSLILAAARLLTDRGIKAAAILNDQGSELVDSHWLQSQRIRTEQVVGGCFCCLFSDLMDAAERLRTSSVEVIFAEAVGSCADISATTLQAIKRYYSDRFRLAPYTVIVDPATAEKMNHGELDPDLAFLFKKQIEEADLTCFSKSDLYPAFPDLPSQPVRHLSPRTGNGVTAWLHEVMAGMLESGTRILDIDYQQYARAEARLAWLNCHVVLTLTTALSASAVVGPLLDNLDSALNEAHFEIAHLKLMNDTPAGSVKASITRNGQDPVVEGDLDASPSGLHELLLNIRAVGEPSILRGIVEKQLSQLPSRFELTSMQCFSPSAPHPEYRIDKVARGINS